MLDYDLDKHLKEQRSLVALRPQIEQVAEQIYSGGYKNLYFIGAGGTYTAALPYERLFQTRSTLPVRAVIGKEFILEPDVGFGTESVAVFSSESGTTTDILECIEFAKAKGALTVGVTGRAESPFAQAVDRVLLTEPGAWPVDVPYLTLSTSLLNCRGEFDGYERLGADLDALPEALAAVTQSADPIGQAFAEKHAKTDYHFLVGTGQLWGYTNLYSMCILEEMQWLKTTRVHGAEFFHGSLELIEAETSIILFMGEDETRPLMERVKKFATSYSNDVTIVDTSSYELPGISGEFRALLAPMIAGAAMDRFSHHLASVRDHSLDTRRYYRVVSY